MFEDRYPIYRNKLTCIQETTQGILPYLETLWNQHDALVPPWVATGGAFSTFPKKEGMDINGKLLHQHPAMSNAINEISTMIDTYWQEINLSQKYKPEIDVMWAQRYIIGEGHNHNHPEYVISGGLYLHVSGKQKITMQTASVSLYNKEVHSALDKTHWDIDLEIGDVLIWPGWMYHSISSVAPENHDGSPTRITMPFMVKAVER